MTANFSPENFWWRNITGPSAMIADTVGALSEGYSVILGVPDFTPWPDRMRGIIREEISGGDVYITVIDAESECSGTAEEFLLSRCDTGRRYRSRLCTAQEYFLRNNLLCNHIFWLHNFRDKAQVSDWVNFCSRYESTSSDTGLFIIDTANDILPAGRMRAVNFADYAGAYDTRIFTSFLLDAETYRRPEYSQAWKDYIAALSAMLCGADAETAERLIRSADFTAIEPFDALNFADGGKSGHDETEIMTRIWMAQVQIFFPMIEISRVKILRGDAELFGRIKFALSWMEANGFPMTQSDGKTVTDPEDLDIGGLFHILCKSNLIKNVDVMLAEYVSLLRTIRNSLAHMTPCKVAEVRELLDFQRHYDGKM